MAKNAVKAVPIEDIEMDEADRLDLLARKNAKARYARENNHTLAPHNMDGKNDKRTLLDDDVNDMETGIRGRATWLVVDMMLAGPTTREHLIDALKHEFPEKEDSVIKNTLGSLMHSIPKKRGWVVQKKPMANDKRKMEFTVVDRGMDSDEERAKRGERPRAHSREGAHAST